VKHAAVCTVMSLAPSRDWSVHQLDVKNAFLHGMLTETVYRTQSTGFFDPAQPDLVCCLNKSMYSLKQTLRMWYNRFASYLLSLGFVEAKSNTSLFIFCEVPRPFTCCSMSTTLFSQLPALSCCSGSFQPCSGSST
jgi:hypothetical protein